MMGVMSQGMGENSRQVIARNERPELFNGKELNFANNLNEPAPGFFTRAFADPDWTYQTVS